MIKDFSSSTTCRELLQPITNHKAHPLWEKKCTSFFIKTVVFLSFLSVLNLSLLYPFIQIKTHQTDTHAMGFAMMWRKSDCIQLYQQLP
jgi:hypothetical protein